MALKAMAMLRPKTITLPAWGGSLSCRVRKADSCNAQTL